QLFYFLWLFNISFSWSLVGYLLQVIFPSGHHSLASQAGTSLSSNSGIIATASSLISFANLRICSSALTHNLFSIKFINASNVNAIINFVLVFIGRIPLAD